MKALFDAHKKDTLPDEQVSVLNEIKSGHQIYLANKETEADSEIHRDLMTQLKRTAIPDSPFRMFLTQRSCTTKETAT